MTETDAQRRTEIRERLNELDTQARAAAYAELLVIDGERMDLWDELDKLNTAEKLAAGKLFGVVILTATDRIYTLRLMTESEARECYKRKRPGNRHLVVQLVRHTQLDRMVPWKWDVVEEKANHDRPRNQVADPR